MRIGLSEMQLEFACRGIRMKAKAKSIVYGYFVELKSESELAKTHDVSQAYVSSLVLKITRNCSKILELNNLRAQVVFVPK